MGKFIESLKFPKSKSKSQLNMENQSQQLITSQLNQQVKELSSSLKTLAPQNSETTQLITYALIATAVVGIFVYHYIKSQEQND